MYKKGYWSWPEMPSRQEELHYSKGHLVGHEEWQGAIGKFLLGAMISTSGVVHIFYQALLPKKQGGAKG